MAGNICEEVGESFRLEVYSAPARNLRIGDFQIHSLMRERSAVGILVSSSRFTSLG